MPLLDSFTVDHTRMAAPAVRVAKTMQTPNKDTITVFDLRFCVPNQEILSERGIHPMGCRTGFYMSLIGAPDEARVGAAWQAAMSDVLTVQEQGKIPELNEYQCGTYSMHSLEEAHAIARHVLERGIGVNRNDELALPEEKLKSL